MKTIYGALVIYSEETTDGWRIRTDFEAFASYHSALEYLNETKDRFRKLEHFKYKMSQIYTIDEVRE